MAHDGSQGPGWVKGDGGKEGVTGREKGVIDTLWGLLVCALWAPRRWEPGLFHHGVLSNWHSARHRLSAQEMPCP